MFFILSKILEFFTQPFFWIAVIIILGIIQTRRHKRKRYLILGGVLFLFFSNQIIYDEIARRWEIDGKNADTIGQYDIAIVLGGMASYNNDLERLRFGEASDRLWQALDLYTRGKVKKLLLSGDSGSLHNDGLDEARQVKEYLVQLGIPGDDIWIETKSINTYENAKYSAKILKEHPEYSKYLLVTSASHMRRANACFRNQGISCISYPVDHKTGARWFNFQRIFIPHLRTVLDWNNLTHEIIGYMMYDLMGYL